MSLDSGAGHKRSVTFGIIAQNCSLQPGACLFVHFAHRGLQ